MHENTCTHLSQNTPQYAAAHFSHFDPTLQASDGFGVVGGGELVVVVGGVVVVGRIGGQ
jgi:hypothetical protein